MSTDPSLPDEVRRLVRWVVLRGDVGGPGAQKTEVQERLCTHDTKSPHVARIHYRICVEEIGLQSVPTDLENFKKP